MAAMFRLLVVCALAANAVQAVAQQAYPNKPIRIIVPFPPGGSVDPLARLIGQKLTESWGQQVIVDNRPGGNSIIGTEAAAKSKPDGYTLLLVSGTLLINANLLSTPYDAIRDFTAVATLISTELILVVNPALPVNTLKEFIALAKAKPGQLNYGSSASGGAIHLATELLSISAGIKMQHVPYKGAAPSITDLIGGQLQLVFQVPTAVIPHIKSGKLRAIAISGEGRLPALPEVPTLTEAGLPGVDVKNWNGLVAPSGTPKEIIDKLAGEIAKILSMPNVREQLINEGNEPLILTPDQFSTLMKADLLKFARIIKTANIKIDN
jgi:tripartite-type tricarboxylate transporter receptor subunit TctC